MTTATMNNNDFSAQLLVALLLVLLSAVLFYIYKRTKQIRRNILLTGLCDSGKTLVFSQLIHGKYVQTYTSMKENVGEYMINNGNLKIVDVPGHERLRLKYLEQYEITARGIVYVIDSTFVKQNIRDTTEYLHLILCDAVKNDIRKVLVLCSKQDQTDAANVETIRDLLEKEMDLVRLTKSKQLDSVYSKEKRPELLGQAGEPFSFSCLNVQVDFAPCSAYATDGDVNIDPLKKWINKIY